jgi:hypothetical protein
LAGRALYVVPVRSTVLGVAEGATCPDAPGVPEGVFEETEEPVNGEV